MVVGREILDHLKPGETVLIKRTSIVEPIMLLSEIAQWAKERGYQIVISDIMDTLHRYKVHMELAGLNTAFINDTKVIKIGGSSKNGQVIGKLDISEPMVQAHKFKKIYEPLLDGGVTVHIILGLAKLLLHDESIKNVLERVHILSTLGDNKRHIVFLFIDVDIVERSIPVAIPLLEEVASTVIEVNVGKREKSNIGKLAYKFAILKSVNNELSGLEFTLI
ncbi:MAG: DUF257 family protein [Thermococcus sp.]|nr:DUF257 family protein [Thermococcus sp.]